MRINLFRALLAPVLLLAIAAGARAGSITEHTLVIPADVPKDARLCTVDVIHRDSRFTAATMMNPNPGPLKDEVAIQASNEDPFYRAWVTTRDGLRTLVVQTTADNKFRLRAIFCRPPKDPSAPVYDNWEVFEPAEGGSENEADPRGTYDGHASKVFEYCGEEFDFDSLQDTSSAITDALEGQLDVEYVMDAFSRRDGTTRINARLIGYRASLQGFAKKIADVLGGIEGLGTEVGNRIVLITNCDHPKGTIRVSRNGQILHETGDADLGARRRADGELELVYRSKDMRFVLQLDAAHGPGSYRVAPTRATRRGTA